jgi:hypothetical protein
VRLENGEVLAARAVVIATEAGAAQRLLGQTGPLTLYNGVTCLYFSTSTPPVREPILLLNGEGSGPVNNLTVLSAVSPAYAPPGRHLVSISVVDPEAAAAVDLEEQVRRQMDAWFAGDTREWELLRIDRIAHAVPFQREAGEMPARLGNGLYICGDHCGIASLNTALVSGTAAAEAILEDLA